MGFRPFRGPAGWVLAKSRPPRPTKLRQGLSLAPTNSASVHGAPPQTGNEPGGAGGPPPRQNVSQRAEWCRRHCAHPSYLSGGYFWCEGVCGLFRGGWEVVLLKWPDGQLLILASFHWPGRNSSSGPAGWAAIRVRTSRRQRQALTPWRRQVAIMLIRTAAVRHAPG